MDDAVALRQAVVLPTNNHVKLTVVGTNSDLGKVESESSKGPLRDIIIEARKAELQELANLESSGATIEYKVLIRYERDLVIKSAEPINGISQFFGGMDMKLLRKCPCPLWIVNSTQQKGFREVLTAAAYDQDDSEADVLNAQILEMATSTALSDFAQLHVVHVWHLQYESFLRSRRLNNTDAEGDAIVEEEKAKRKLWLEGLIARHCGAQDKDAIGYLQPIDHLPQSDARYEVPMLAEAIKAELVVMGTIGRSGIPGILIGNTAETISHQISCSVLAVKPAGFVSPITLSQMAFSTVC